MTYKELVYMCLDEIKLSSDDSYITEDHILFLISKYRAFALRQKYEKTNMPVSESNYQLISVQPNSSIIPDIMTVAKPRVFQETTGTIKYLTYVSPHRYHFVGKNSILTSITYCTIDHNKKLKCSSKISGNVLMYAVFEDIIKASEFNNTKDILEQECPIETELIPGIQELVVKDVLGISYRPQDTINNAHDDFGNYGAVRNSNRNNK